MSNSMGASRFEGAGSFWSEPPQESHPARDSHEPGRAAYRGAAEPLFPMGPATPGPVDVYRPYAPFLPAGNEPAEGAPA
ncbi:MAG TPA: hypothetical protein VNK95_21985, partial [Caldilineaceae bacterium]|nr:hypothetical protein [Caldilineaceae bacterium]